MFVIVFTVHALIEVTPKYSLLIIVPFHGYSFFEALIATWIFVRLYCIMWKRHRYEFDRKKNSMLAFYLIIVLNLLNIGIHDVRLHLFGVEIDEKNMQKGVDNETDYMYE